MANLLNEVRDMIAWQANTSGHLSKFQSPPTQKEINALLVKIDSLLEKFEKTNPGKLVQI